MGKTHGFFPSSAGARRVPERLGDRDLGAARDASRALGSLGAGAAVCVYGARMGDGWGGFWTWFLWGFYGIALGIDEWVNDGINDGIE